ncbi:alpha/beta fold hydrolase [Luteimonas sp BLCC-B24]|uniref:alpha/beta hydrolase family protein n=1 Tax=Luteimonas sp. BLCC-B24 TaxID=3025317 RepID=UPI00234E0222|nr:alpha/beta fold hydrolase [Luteimonas sp. BLCC-B24]MDC7805800.1 alpha/beta fold hydrolase [Luteimonas sp. BLCC-B24]
MSTAASRLETLVTADGHRYELIARIPDDADRALLWLPAMGVPAKHYLPLAERLAARGVAVFLHEWRGIGSSGLRAGGGADWGYRELLDEDIATSARAMRAATAGLAPVIGGHSLGGQLACCHLARQPDGVGALWLVASGAPYWRAFPVPQRYALPPLYRFMAWLSRVRGVLPGRRLGFAGNEAPGVIADWSRSGITGSYRAAGLELDLDAALARVDVPVRAVCLQADWLGPPSSLHFLLSKLGTSVPAVVSLDAAALGVAADHFAWMKRPDAVVEWLTRSD